MKINIVDDSGGQIGGGWTFIRNFHKYLGTDAVGREDAEVFFIPSASMIQKETFEQLKATGKPIVLRIDNALKDSRNRGAGMSRLLKYAKGADLCIFQSNWAYKYLSPWFIKHGAKNVEGAPIVYNGGDTDIFYPSKDNKPSFDYRYLFIKDKRFDEAAYHFYHKAIANPEAMLTIVGRFDPKLAEYGFDFFNDEKVHYLGQIVEPMQMAEIMRNHDVLLFPAYADACPQTVVEARLCGLKVELVNKVGGTRELMQLPVEFLTFERMGDEITYEIEKIYA